MKENDKAPDFETIDSANARFKLSDYKNNKNVILYFYPKDDTPGCTIQAIEFSAMKNEFENVDAVIIGISADSLASHCSFIEKHGLGIILALDENMEISKLYDVIQPKILFGKKYTGIVRSTFLINKEGIIKKIWTKVNVSNHAAEVMKALVEMRKHCLGSKSSIDSGEH